MSTKTKTRKGQDFTENLESRLKHYGFEKRDTREMIGSDLLFAYRLSLDDKNDEGIPGHQIIGEHLDVQCLDVVSLDGKVYVFITCDVDILKINDEWVYDEKTIMFDCNSFCDIRELYRLVAGKELTETKGLNGEHNG